jgi:hypothetical protein
MPDSVNVPLIGQLPKRGVVIGVVGGGGLLAYLYYRRKKMEEAASKTGAPDGAYAYGYGAGAVPSGYYGYGYGYGNPAFGGGMTPYPIGSEYSYGAYGYGYYNPYTGQYLGGGTGQGGFTVPPTTPPPWWTTPPKWWNPGGNKPGTSVITADGHHNLQQYGREFGVSKRQIVLWNPHLASYMGTGKPIKRGTRVKV